MLPGESRSRSSPGPSGGRTPLCNVEAKCVLIDLYGAVRRPLAPDRIHRPGNRRDVTGVGKDRIAPRGEFQRGELGRQMIGGGNFHAGEVIEYAVGSASPADTVKRFSIPAGNFRSPRHTTVSAATVTIQPTPKRSVTMPKHGDQNVLASGIWTWPPSERAVNARWASACVGKVSESRY